MISTTIYSMNDIEKAVKTEVAKLQELMYAEMNKLQARITNLEDVIKIYKGSMVFNDQKNQQASVKKKA